MLCSGKTANQPGQVSLEKNWNGQDRRYPIRSETRISGETAASSLLHLPEKEGRVYYDWNR